MGEAGIDGTWRKSSYSGGDNNCVEVGTADAEVTVRNTKDRPGGALQFSARAWLAFTEGICRPPAPA